MFADIQYIPPDLLIAYYMPGDVSIALDGTLKKYEDLVSLKQDLEKILGYKNSEDIKEKRTIFKINNLLAIRKTEDKN